jgi:oligopeptide transport system substrate-binding protein
VQIDCVEVHVIADITAALAQYEAGDLDIIEGVLTLAALTRVRQDPTLRAELHEVLRAATAYIGFTMTKPPFDNVLVRKAFSAALDRATLVAGFIGCGAPTTQFGPRGVFGAPDPQVGQDYDPGQAKASLAAAGYPNGAGFPTVTFRFADSMPELYEAMQSMWKQTLNVDVALERAPWAGYFAGIAPSVPPEEMPHMWYSGMFAAYPDENNFVYETFHCTDSPNETRATCTRADDLAKAAGREQDPEQRKLMYREVEQLMFGDEARAAPFWQWGFTILTKPHIKRAYPTFAHLNWDTWKVVES